jgi:hypothetical protein
MAEDAAAEAAKTNEVPYVAFEDGDPGVFRCPFLGDYIPEGWKQVDELFVDSSGVGADDEPALTHEQFLSKVKSGMGYAIAEAGQFQVYIRVYEKV